MSTRNLVIDGGGPLIYTMGSPLPQASFSQGVASRSHRLLLLLPGQPLYFTVAPRRRAALKWFPGLDPRYPR